MATLATEPLTASIGAIVTGASLRDCVADPQLRNQVRAALWEHLVLAFPGQFLDDETHLAVAGLFGEPFVHPIARALGRTEPMEEIADDATKLPDRDGWHTDAPFLVEPPSVAILRAVTVPDSGGDTLWANMYAAYDGLSDLMQRMLEGLEVAYPPQQGLFDYVEEHLGRETADQVRELAGDGGVHPLVRTHPETGRRSLYYAEGFAGPIVGLTDDENAALRALLRRAPTDPSIQCRWRWHEGDVVMWDECATQHFGAADHRGQARTMRRVMVAGKLPG